MMQTASQAGEYLEDR